jgi:apolipoprotein N-acyltransferase
VLICIEITDNIGGSGTALAFAAGGTNCITWCGVAAIVALDTAVWMHGWLLVVLTGAALLTAAGIYWLTASMLDTHQHAQ